MGTLRIANSKDRLIDVGGYSVPPETPEATPEEFFQELAEITADEYNPIRVLVVSPSVEFANELISAVRDAGGKKDGLFHLKSTVINGVEHHFSFKSRDDAYLFVDCMYGKIKPKLEDGQEPFPDRIGAVVMLFQDEHEQYLPHVLKCCQDLRVYCVRYCTGPTRKGMFARTDLPGFEGVPQSVDLDAPDDKDSDIDPFPVAAMYGRCKEIAEQTLCPRGYAYGATLASTSVFVKPTQSVRSNLYVGKIGPVHSGKSLANERVQQLLGLIDMDGNATEQLVDGTPASDRGLYHLLPCEVGPAPSRLLYSDEGRDLMAKANIQGSSLIPVLNKLFNSNSGGVSDKLSYQRLNVRLSMSINLTVKDPDEFTRIFTHETSHGLWDRYLYFVRREKWRYTPWEFSFFEDVHVLEPTTPTISGKIFAAAHEWSAAGEDRDRLSEIGLRIAYITSAINKDAEVSREAIDAALCLMDWQEKIRRDFQPAKGSSEAEECVKTILAAFTEANGYKYAWRDTAYKRHWYEKFARTLRGTKKMLVDEGVIAKDKETGLFYLNREKQKEKNL